MQGNGLQQEKCSTTGIFALFATLIRSSRLRLGMEAPILWVIPGLVGIALTLYLTAQIGQKLGADQRFILQHFLHNTLHKKSSNHITTTYT